MPDDQHGMRAPKLEMEIEVCSGRMVRSAELPLLSVQCGPRDDAALLVLRGSKSIRHRKMAADSLDIYDDEAEYAGVVSLYEAPKEEEFVLSFKHSTREYPTSRQLVFELDADHGDSLHYYHSGREPGWLNAFLYKYKYSVCEQYSVAQCRVKGKQVTVHGSSWAAVACMLTKLIASPEFRLQPKDLIPVAAAVDYAAYRWGCLCDPAEEVEAQGVMEDLVERVQRIAAVLRDLWASSTSGSTKWYQEVMAGLGSVVKSMLARPLDFLRECVSNFILSFVSVKFHEALSSWAEELKVLCRTVIRWAFGFSMTQLILDILFECKEKMIEVVTDHLSYLVSGVSSQAADGPESVLGLVVTCLFTFIGLRDLPAGAKPSLAKAVKEMTVASRGSTVIASQFSGSLSWIRDCVLRAVYGPLYRRAELFERWPATAGAFFSATAYLGLEKPMIHQLQLLKESIRAYHLEWKNMDRDSRQALTPYLPVIAEAERRVVSVHLTESRSQPEVFVWMGESGVGKSHLSKIFIDAAHKWKIRTDRAAGVDESMIPLKRASFVFTYNAARSHFDGYALQLVTQLPEFLQFKATTVTRSTEAPAFMGMASNDDFEPPMAHLDAKGIPFISRAIVITTNSYVWEWDEDLPEVKSPLAFKRRATKAIVVSRKPGVVKKRHVVDHQDRAPDEYLDFHLHDPVTGEKLRKVTFIELIKMLCDAVGQSPYEPESAVVRKVDAQLLELTATESDIKGSRQHLCWHNEVAEKYGPMLLACPGCDCTLESWAAESARKNCKSVSRWVCEHVEVEKFAWHEVEQMYPTYMASIVLALPNMERSACASIFKKAFPNRIMRTTELRRMRSELRAAGSDEDGVQAVLEAWRDSPTEPDYIRGLDFEEVSDEVHDEYEDAVHEVEHTQTSVHFVRNRWPAMWHRIVLRFPNLTRNFLVDCYFDQYGIKPSEFWLEKHHEKVLSLPEDQQRDYLEELEKSFPIDPELEEAVQRFNHRHSQEEEIELIEIDEEDAAVAWPAGEVEAVSSQLKELRGQPMRRTGWASRPEPKPKAQGFMDWLGWTKKAEPRYVPIPTPTGVVWMDKGNHSGQAADLETVPGELGFAIATPIDEEAMDPHLLALCRQAMEATTISACWSAWLVAQALVQDIAQIPAWCSPFLVFASAYGHFHPALFHSCGYMPIMSRHLDESLATLAHNTIEPSLVAKMMSAVINDENVEGAPAEPNCPGAWFMCRKEHAPELTPTAGQATTRFLSLADLQIGAHLRNSPILSEMDRYALRYTGMQVKSLVGFALGLVALAGVVLAAKNYFSRKQVEDFERKGIFAHSAAEEFDVPVAGLSANETNLLRVVRSSCVSYSRYGEEWTGAFMLNEHEMLLAGHTFKDGEDFWLLRGKSRWRIKYDGGKGYAVATVDDLALVRFFNVVIPGCRDHMHKFPTSLPCDATTASVLAVGRLVEGSESGCSSLSQVEKALSVYQSSQLSYSGPSGVLSVPSAWKSTYKGYTGKCGTVLFQLGAVHPLLGIHVAGDAEHSWSRAISSQTLERLSSMCAQRITIGDPDTGFSPFSADMEKAFKHEGYVVGGMKSAKDTIVGDLVPTPFSMYTELEYFPSAVENTHPDTTMDPDHLGLQRWDDARLREASSTISESSFVHAAWVLGQVEGAMHGVVKNCQAAGIDLDSPPPPEDTAAGSPFLDPLVRSTSIGPSDANLGPTKAEYCEPGDPIRYKQWMREALRKQVADLKEGRAKQCKAKIARKIEKDKIHKVVVGKARLYYVVDGREVCTGRAIFYRYLEARKLMGLQLGMAVGILPQYYHTLHQASKEYSHLLDSDIEGQDVSIRYYHLIAVYAYMLGTGLLGDRTTNGMHFIHPELPKVDALGLAQFTYLHRCPLMAYAWFSVLLEFGAGNPSGGLLTWDINVIINKLSYYWVFAKRSQGVAGIVGFDSARLFLKQVYFIGGGDDALIFLRGAAVQAFSSGWEQDMMEVGFKVTDPNNKLAAPRVREMRRGVAHEDCSFLGRQWKKEGGLYRGVLELKRITKIFQYCKRGEMLKTFPLTVVDALWELKWWGERKYSKFVAQFPPEARISYEELQVTPKSTLALKIAGWLSQQLKPEPARLDEVMTQLKKDKSNAPIYMRTGGAMVGESVRDFIPRPVPVAQGGESSGEEMVSEVPAVTTQDQPSQPPSMDQDFAREIDGSSSILHKPYMVRALSWTPASPVSFWSDRYPSAFLAGNFEAQKALVNRGYLRGRMHIRVIPTSTPMDCGSVWVYALPLVSGLPRSYTEATGHYGAYLDANSEMGVEIVVPYVRDMKAVRIEDFASGGLALRRFDWCSVGGYVITPIGTRIGATYPTLVVEAWMEEVELLGMYYNPIVLTSQGGEAVKLAAQPLTRTLVKTAAGVLAEVAQMAVKKGGVVLLGALAAGMSKPVRSTGIDYMKMETWGGASHVNAQLPAVTLGDGPQAQRTTPPGGFGFAEDQASFAVYAARPAVVRKIPWHTGSPALTLLTDAFGGVFPGTPWVGYTQVAVTTNVGLKSMYALSPAAYLAQTFLYWRGTVVWTFKVVCTKFHAGRLRVAYAPGGAILNAAVSANRTQNYKNLRWDITKCTQLTVRVPFTFPGAMMQRHQIHGAALQPGLENGSVGLYVDTPLRVTNEAVDTAVTIEVSHHVEDSAWSVPMKNFAATDAIWRGPDYVAPVPQGKGKGRSDFYVCICGAEYSGDTCPVCNPALPKAQGGESLQLRDCAMTEGLMQDGCMVWQPEEGLPYCDEAVRAAVGSVFDNWRQLMKRPGDGQEFSPLSQSSISVHPRLWEHAWALATFGWCCGDMVIATKWHLTQGLVAVEVERSQCIRYTRCYFASPNGAVSAPTGASSVYYVDGIENGMTMFQLQCSGTRKMYPLNNALSYEGNRWGVGAIGFTITTSQYIMPRLQYVWAGDNFDLGWQIAPPMVELGTTLAPESYALLDAPSDYF